MKFTIGLIIFVSGFSMFGQTCANDKNGLNISDGVLYVCPPGALSGGQSTQIDWTTQIKNLPFIDIRTISGVDCSGITDSTIALNTYFANGSTGVDGREIVLPLSCVLKIGSNGTGITIRNHMGFKIKGYSQPGDGGNAAFGNPEIQWCQSSGPASATMIDMERVHSFGLEGIVLDAHGPVASGCTTPAGIALNVDLSGTGNLITTFGEFRNISVLAGGYQGGSHDTNFIGMQFSNTSGSNVEDMRIYDSSFNCNETAPGNGNSRGIVWGPASFNTHEEWVYFTNFSNCRYGQDLGEGQVFVYGGDYSTNGTDFHWRGNAQSGAFISGIESENSGQFFTTDTLGGGTGTLTIRDDDFEPFSFALPNTCGVDINSNGSTAMSVTIENFGTGGSAVSGWNPICSNQNSTITFRNVKIADVTNNPLHVAGNSRFPVMAGKNLGATFSHVQGAYYRVGGNFSQGGNADMGYGFFDSQGYEVPGLAYDNSTNDGVIAGGINLGRDVMYVGAGANIVLKAMRPVSQPSISCVVNGAGGVTTYIARIFAKDAAGKRGGFVDYTGNEGKCNNAAASFSVGNGITVTWPTVPNATNGYDVVIMNPAASTSQGWLAGSTAQGTTTLAITSGPGSFNYSFPAYSESAQLDVNGERFTNNVSYQFGSGLPAQPNGSQLYCSDCNATCTAGGGTGRTCFRENGAWTH